MKKILLSLILVFVFAGIGWGEDNDADEGILTLLCKGTGEGVLYDIPAYDCSDDKKKSCEHFRNIKIDFTNKMIIADTYFEHSKEIDSFKKTDTRILFSAVLENLKDKNGVSYRHEENFEINRYTGEIVAWILKRTKTLSGISLPEVLGSFRGDCKKAERKF